MTDMTYEESLDLFTTHQDLLNSMCWHVANKTGYEFDELRSEASLVFMKACSTFDPAKGAFSTCLSWMLRGHLYNFVYKMWKDEFTQDIQVEGTTNQTPYHKLKLQDEIKCLSKEAQDVCNIVLSCPMEVLDIDPGTPPKMVRGAIVRHLQENGVSRPRAWDCIREIKQMLVML